jgi:uncharacterized protein (DUF4415 family)
MTHLSGDKLLIKTGIHAGHRAVLVSLTGEDRLIVALSQTQGQVVLKSSDIVNYSLAARKAWQKMPRRNVGRPHGTKVCDRISVTLRIDRETWGRFQTAESEGRIQDRTATVNTVLRDFLQRLGKRNIS